MTYDTLEMADGTLGRSHMVTVEVIVPVAVDASEADSSVSDLIENELSGTCLELWLDSGEAVEVELGVVDIIDANLISDGVRYRVERETE